MDDSSFISLLKSPIYRVLIKLKFMYYTMSFITQFSLFGNQGQNQASLSNIHSKVES